MAAAAADMQGWQRRRPAVNLVLLRFTLMGRWQQEWRDNCKVWHTVTTSTSCYLAGWLPSALLALHLKTKSEENDSLLGISAFIHASQSAWLFYHQSFMNVGIKCFCCSFIEQITYFDWAQSAWNQNESSQNPNLQTSVGHWRRLRECLTRM